MQLLTSALVQAPTNSGHVRELQRDGDALRRRCPFDPPRPMHLDSAHDAALNSSRWTRRALLGSFSLAGVLVSGCFSDPGGTDPGTSTDGATTDPSDSTSDDDSDAGGPSGDPSGGGCLGCLDAAGGCLAGNLDQACGTLAERCVVCEAGSFCDEGMCAPLPACRPETCDGCCDGDECRDGLDPAACGRDGQQCSDCPAGSTCGDGVCDLPCADNCLGCCDTTGNCIELEATTDNACGSDGNTCEACPAGFSCSEGTCISTACQATCDGCCDGAECNEGNDVLLCGQDGNACEACPLGTLCEGTCVADPDEIWQLVITSATTNPTDLEGDAWDLNGGLPDPFFRVTFDGESQDTSEIDDTTTPEWNESLFVGLTTAEMSMPMTFELRDSDFLSSTSMGACGIQIPTDQFAVPLIADCVDSETDTVLWTVQFTVALAPL